MSEPTPRQVLYALVSGGFVVVALALVGGAAVAGVVPLWWTILSAVALVSFAVWAALNWRRTTMLLAGSIGLLVLWAIGTLVVAG